MGWEQIMTALMLERGGALKRYAFLLCGDDDTAEDLLQEALVRVLSRPFSSSDLPRVEGYVRRTLVNLSVDRYRSQARWRRFVPLLMATRDLPDHSTVVVASMDMNEALATLSPRQRACVLLRFYDDLPVGVIAEALGCSQGAVKRYLSDAMARLAAVFASSEGSTRCRSTQR